MRLDIFIHTAADNRKLDHILALLNQILLKETQMAGELDKLEADVAAESGAVDSAITLLQGLKAALDAAGTDPVRLAALSAAIEAKTEAIAAAVVANTPAAPTP